MDTRVLIPAWLLVLVLMGTGVNGQDVCAQLSGYTDFNGRCYKGFSEQKLYSEAMNTCAAEGGVLAMAKDEATNNFIAGLQPGGWFGLSDLNTEGLWEWSDGTPLSGYINWSPGEPTQDRHDEDCVHFYSNLKWNDHYCTDTRLGFICEVNPATDPCAANPCQNGGVCTVSGDSYTCECAEGSEGPNCEIGCPSDYTPFEGACAKTYDERKNYNDARQVCADRGGLLAMPKDSIVDHALLALLDGTSHYWIGLNDLETEGVWKWEDGTPMNPNYHRFWPGYPNGGDSEDCSHYHYGRHADWTDMSCSRGEKFICQLSQGKDLCNPNPCQNGGVCTDDSYTYTCECADGWNGRNCEGSCRSGYTPHGGKCYKAYDEDKTYSEARQVCADDGGTLAMPKDSDVYNFLVRLRNPVGWGTYWIGLNDLATEGVWMWEDGTPHDTTTDYDGWLSGEPNQSGDCARYDNDVAGKWSDIQCSNSNRFFCQLETATDPCDPNPCQNGGVCTTSGNSYTCDCADGWEGTNCETDVDECTDNSNNCHEQATCANTDGGFTCTCNSGYNGDGVNCTGCPSGYIPYGDWCYKNYNGNKPWSEARQVCADDGGLLAMPKDSGVHNFLKNNLADINHYYWIGLSDLATEGAWMWEDGTPHDITADFNVWNGGEPNSAGDEDCVHYEPNLTGWNDQGCSSGFSFICQVRLGTDHCDPNPCQNGGVCTTSGDSYNCECADGWEGPNCDTDVDECADDSDNCHEQATCANTDGGFTCACNSGYSGDGVTCTDVDECADGSHNCHLQATCTNTDGGFTCACNSGYNGDGVTCTGLSDLTFTDVEMDYMSLSWTAPAGVSQYRLRYSHAGASYQDLSPPPAPSDTTATVAGLLADTEYTFTLTAFGADGEVIGGISGTETTAEVIVNVECYEDYMTVAFPRAVLEAAGVTLDLYLLDNNCRSTVTDQLVTLVAPLQSCGTIQDSSEDDKFIFTNEAIGSQETADNGAVRGTPFSKRFQCEFVRQYVVSQGRQIMYNIPLPRVQVVDGETSFTFEMHMYTSSDFTATYESPDFPLQVSSSDHLNFGLSVKSPLNNLQLFALHCLATPTTDPAATPSVSIIQDGCDIDPTLQLDSTLSNDMALYYSIQSFTFPNIDDPSLVYIHCTMVVCFKDDTNSRCSEGCVPAARRRRAVSDKSEARVRRASENDHQADIMQGPFAVKGGQNQASTVPTVGIAVGTVAGIAGALLVVFAVLLVRKRRGRDAKEQAEDRVGFDNYSLELWGKDKAANGTPKPE